MLTDPSTARFLFLTLANRVRACWRGLVERGWTLAGEAAARCGGRGVGFRSSARARVIESLEGDFDCLIEDATERSMTERSAEELLLTGAVLRWLRGGELPGRGAVEFLEEQVAAFNRAPHESERDLRQALRDALEELVRAQAEAIAAGRWSRRDLDVEASTERGLRRFGQKLDELRKGMNMTIGELAARAGIEVVGIVGFIYGAEEPGAVEMMRLAAALESEPRELFPEFLAWAEDEEGDDCSGGNAGGEGGGA